MKKIRRSTIWWIGIVFCFLMVLFIQAFRFNIPAVIIAEFEIGTPTEHENYIGNLIIESVGVNIPCIESADSNQALNNNAVHKLFCAAKIWYSLGGVNVSDSSPGTWVICDHNWQGFSAIMDCKSGDEAVITSPNGKKQKYVVIDMFEGYVNEYGLLVDVTGDEFLQSKPENLVLMTCHPDADVPADREDRRFFVYLELVQD